MASFDIGLAYSKRKRQGVAMITRTSLNAAFQSPRVREEFRQAMKRAIMPRSDLETVNNRRGQPGFVVQYKRYSEQYKGIDGGQFFFYYKGQLIPSSWVYEASRESYK